MPVTKYPWEKWLDGKPHRIRHGSPELPETVPYSTVVALAHQYAKRRGLKVSTHYDREKKTLTIHAFTPKDPK